MKSIIKFPPGHTTMEIMHTLTKEYITACLDELAATESNYNIE